jgi:hypothetical protein
LVLQQLTRVHPCQGPRGLVISAIDDSRIGDGESLREQAGVVKGCEARGKSEQESDRLAGMSVGDELLSMNDVDLTSLPSSLAIKVTV